MSCPYQSFDLRLLITLGEEYNACNFLHFPVISSLLAPNIYLSSLFSNTLNLCSSLEAREQDSQPYNTTGSIIVLYVDLLTLNFLESRRTIKLPQVNNNMHFLFFFLRLISSRMSFVFVIGLTCNNFSPLL